MLPNLTDDKFLGRFVEGIQLLLRKDGFGIDIIIEKGHVILAE